MHHAEVIYDFKVKMMKFLQAISEESCQTNAQTDTDGRALLILRSPLVRTGGE